MRYDYNQLSETKIILCIIFSFLLTSITFNIMCINVIKYNIIYDIDIMHIQYQLILFILFTWKMIILFYLMISIISSLLDFNYFISFYTRTNAPRSYTILIVLIATMA